MTTNTTTLEEALDAARNATGDTLLVLVNPRQAERLRVALQIAEKMLSRATDPLRIKILEVQILVERYEELSR